MEGPKIHIPYEGSDEPNVEHVPVTPDFGIDPTMKNVLDDIEKTIRTQEKELKNPDLKDEERKALKDAIDENRASIKKIQEVDGESAAA
jgi:hypothetical protein